MEEKERELKIPTQTSDRNDYIQGVGAKELTEILISLIIAVVLTCVFYFVFGNLLIALFVGFFALASTIIAVKRDAINESMIDKLRLIMHYAKMQKKYEYEYRDSITGEVQNGNNK